MKKAITLLAMLCVVACYKKPANTFDEKGDHDRAISDFNEAIRLKPKNAEAYYSRGVTYYHKGEEEAIENLKKRGQKQ